MHLVDYKVRVINERRAPPPARVVIETARDRASGAPSACSRERHRGELARPSRRAGARAAPPARRRLTRGLRLEPPVQVRRSPSSPSDDPRGSAAADARVLLAAGRVPNTDRLAPRGAGGRPRSKGFIVVNDRLETSATGVRALGDVKGGPGSTHMSYDHFRVVQANLLRDRDATTRGHEGAGRSSQRQVAGGCHFGHRRRRDHGDAATRRDGKSAVS